ncbi:MAG: ribosome silencing factor [Williamsia sp.]|nr:ribosome silencing factor [Williamsia sp.]
MTVLATRNRRQVARLTRSSKIFKTILHAIQEKKGTNIVSLDLRKIPEAVSDFFIICTAGSNIQSKAIAEYVEEQVKKVCGEDPFKHEGFQAAQWVLIDYVNVVVHIMQEESRNFYRLEDLWSDAPVMEHKD